LKIFGATETKNIITVRNTNTVFHESLILVVNGTGGISIMNSTEVTEEVNSNRLALVVAEFNATINGGTTAEEGFGSVISFAAENNEGAPGIQLGTMGFKFSSPTKKVEDAVFILNVTDQGTAGVSILNITSLGKIQAQTGNFNHTYNWSSDPALANTDGFFFCFGDAEVADAATENKCSQMTPIRGVVTGITGFATAAAGAGEYELTLRINGADSIPAMLCTFANGDTTCSVTGVVGVEAGDRIGAEWDGDGAGTPRVQFAIVISNPQGEFHKTTA